MSENEAWDQVYAYIGEHHDRTPQLSKAAWVVQRDGYLSAEAMMLCDPYRVPPQLTLTRMRSCMSGRGWCGWGE